MAARNFDEEQFMRHEMENEALFTESAYFSEHKPGPNAPNQTNSFAHSVIQSHIDGRINVNQMSPPVFT
jgi:hypothetical protein